LLPGFILIRFESADNLAFLKEVAPTITTTTITTTTITTTTKTKTR